MFKVICDWRNDAINHPNWDAGHLARKYSMEVETFTPKSSPSAAARRSQTTQQEESNSATTTTASPPDGQRDKRRRVLLRKDCSRVLFEGDN